MTPEERWKKEYRPHSGAITGFQLFIALSGAFALATISIVQRAVGDDLTPLVQRFFSGQFSIMDVAHLLAYVFFVVFGLFWAINGWREIHYLQDWLKPPKALASSRYAIHVFAVWIGILLGCLFAVSANFKALVIVFGIYSLADLYLWKIRQKEIASLIYENEAALRHDLSVLQDGPVHRRQKAIRNVATFAEANIVLKRYYVARPHKTRVFVQVVVMSVLAVLWLTQAPALLKIRADWIEVGGYAAFLACAVGCEYVIHRWRRVMDMGLAKLDQQLSLAR